MFRKLIITGALLALIAIIAGASGDTKTAHAQWGCYSHSLPSSSYLWCPASPQGSWWVCDCCDGDCSDQEYIFEFYPVYQNWCNFEPSHLRWAGDGTWEGWIIEQIVKYHPRWKGNLGLYTGCGSPVRIWAGTTTVNFSGGPWNWYYHLKIGYN